MSAHGLTQQQMDEAVAMVRAAGSVAAASRHAGISRTTLQHRYLAAKAGQPAAAVPEPEEARQESEDSEDRSKGTRSISCRLVGVSSLEEALDRFEVDLAVWEVERYTINAWGSASKEGDAVLHQVKVWLKRRVSHAIEDAAATLAKRVKPIPIGALPRKRRSGRLAVGGPYDVHFGQMVSPTTVPGRTDNLALAEERYVNAIDAVFARLREERPSRLIMPIANDFMHFDNRRAETTSGNHAVDYGAFYHDMVLTGHRMLEYTARRGLDLACDVELVYVPDNHAELTGWHMAHWLAARLQGCKRVSVCTKPHKFKFREHGANLIGLTHGHRVGKARLYEVMTEEARDKWAGKVCCEWHVGHLHHIESGPPKNKSLASMVVRQHSSMSVTNGYEYELGFVGSRPQIQMHLYDERAGHVGEITEYAEVS